MSTAKTIKEIIKNLLDQAADRESSIDPDDPKDIFRLDARALREAARLLSKTEPPDVPLTLEQLREMDGEPVWTVDLDGGTARWAFVSSDYELVRWFAVQRNVACDVIARSFKTYRKAWLAYLRRPEKETT